MRAKSEKANSFYYKRDRLNQLRGFCAVVQNDCSLIKASEKFFKTISYIFLGYLLCLAFIYPLIVSSEFSYFYTLSLIIIISISTFAEYYFGMAYRLYLQAEQKSYIISLIQIIT